jgi:hypothetical protein
MASKHHRRCLDQADQITDLRADKKFGPNWRGVPAAAAWADAYRQGYYAALMDAADPGWDTRGIEYHRDPKTGALMPDE